MGSAFIFLVSLAASAHSAAPASSPDVEKLLEQMRGAYSSAKSAQFKVAVDQATQNGPVIYTMGVQYKAPNLFSSELTTPSGITASRSDGKLIWSTQKEGEPPREVPWTLDNVQRAIGGNLETICFMDYKRQLSTAKGANMETSKLGLRKDVEWNGKKWTVLDEEAPAAGVCVEYYIEPKTHLIHRTQVMSLDKKTRYSTYVVTELKLNVPCDEEKFKKPKVVTPPADTIKI